jgi:hypothetical protein
VDVCSIIRTDIRRAQAEWRPVGIVGKGHILVTV